MKHQTSKVRLAALLLAAMSLIFLRPVPAMAGPATGQIKIGNTSYPSLEAAILAAQAGDTLVLSGGDLIISQTVSVPAGKNLTLDLGGNALISQIDIPNHRMLSVTSAAGAFTLKNGRLTAQDTNGDGMTGGAIYSSRSNLTLERIKADNFKTSAEGGVVYVAGSSSSNIEVLISGCDFHDNSAFGNGGAISLSSLSPASKAQIINNTISNNSVRGNTHSYGGGISLCGKGSYTVSGNTIDSNQASTNNLYDGFHWSHGGGMHIESPVGSREAMHVTLENNIISNNQTQLFGGGMYFNMTKSYGDTIDLKSGVFSQNHSGYAGGAIDYSIHGQPTLVLRNALFTGNKARAGGGIWACPTARTISYSTLGGVILENLLDEGSVPSVYQPTGHEVRFEGSDTKIPGILAENDPSYHRMTVFERTFLGDKVNWYADEPGDLYEPGDAPADPGYYTDRPTSFGLYGELVSPLGWYNRHKPSALLIFEGNTAGRRGGAISTNSDIQIGEEGDVSLSVSKKWLDNAGAPLSGKLPASVDVQLIRKDSKGGAYPLETVQLTSANGWSHTFTKLPAKGRVNGEVLSFTYTVKEARVSGFSTAYETVSPSEMVITNTSEDGLSVPLKVSKVLKNGSLKGGEFTFQLKDKHGKLIAQAKNAADGSVTFPDRTFSKEVTDWTYTIHEVKGTDPKISYDKTVYTVKITTRMVNGSLKATVHVEKDGTPYAGSISFVNQRRMPSTGDNAYWLIIALVAASLMIAGVCVFIRKQRKQH